MNTTLKTALVLGVLMGSAACSKKKRNAPASVEEPLVENVHIRSFDQLNVTFSMLTEVPASAVAAQYNRDASGSGLRGYLPPGNSLTMFSGSQQGAIVRLAAGYCDQFVNRLSANGNAGLKARYPFYSTFADDPAADLTRAKVDQLTSAFYSDFWGACLKGPTLVETREEIWSLVSGMKTEFGNDTTLNRPTNHLRMICTVFLASSCVTLY